MDGFSSGATVAAIIPVRGGSVAVPGKNLRSLAGRPLLWYAISSARSASVVTFTVVSTEDEEIERYAQSQDVEVVRHPPELSTDVSPTFPVLQWCLHCIQQTGRSPDICVMLRATTPLRTGQDIDGAVQLLINNPIADSVVSVVPAVGMHPVRLKRVLSDGRLVDAFDPEGSFPKRRQELETLYARNGAVYVSRSSIIPEGKLWGSHCLAYVMPEERSININTEFQFRVAELLVSNACKPSR